MSTFAALMRAIQKASSPAVWSAGVQLSRAGAVTQVTPQALRAEDIEVQVAGQRGTGAVWVSLWPQDGDWSCACVSSDDACMHAAAAVIACNQAALGKGWAATGPDASAPSGAHGAAPKAASAPGHISYQFRHEQNALSLQRTVVTGDHTEPLNIPIVAFARAQNTQVLAQPHDSLIDTLMVGRGHGPLTESLLHKLLAALVDAAHVSVQGAPMTVGPARSGQELVLSERPGGGVLMRLVRAQGITALFSNGAALMGNKLVPMIRNQLAEHERRGLEAGVVVPPERHSELFGTLLPRLGQTLPIQWGTVRRTREVRLPPLLHLQVQWQRDAQGAPQSFEVLPTVVYGNPPLARVVGTSLRAMGQEVPKRLLEAEAALFALLDQELQLVPNQRHGRVGAQGVALAQAVQDLGARSQVIVDDPSGALAAFAVRSPLTPHLSVHGDGFELHYTTGDGTATEGAGHTSPSVHAPSSVGAEEVQQAWRDQQPLVPLMGGGFAPLPTDFLQAHGALVALLLQAREAQLAAHTRHSRGLGGTAHPLPPWALPHLVALAEATHTPVPDELLAMQHTLAATDAQAHPGEAEVAPAEQAYALPEGMQLRPYQATGVAWLRARLSHGLGVLLADDMGLGKTLQALLSREGRTLVVAPTSVLFNWAEEADRLGLAQSICTYHGPHRTLDAQADLTLTSYGILRQEGPKLAQHPFDTVILDEAQSIKNPSSQTAHAAFALSSLCPRRVALTGTPVENRLDELWSQCHFLNPGLLGSLSEFKRTIAEPIALAAAKDGDGAQLMLGPAQAAGARATTDLRRRLAPIMLRRTKAQVAQDLPPRTDVVLRCTLTAQERAVYNSVQAATRAQVLRALQAGGTVMQALEALLRLRQAACHAGLVPGQEAATSSKVQLLLHTLQQGLHEGHRALVFSQWTSLLDRIEPHLREAQISYARLDGSTADRGAVVHRFVDPKGPQVLLASLKAGGVGLNLTAADHVFLLDPWWNPAAEDQAADRAHRIGQTRSVLVHRLVAEDTVEENILRLQDHKRALAAAALNHEEAGNGRGFTGATGVAPGALAGGGGLSRQDLFELLGQPAATAPV